MRHCEVILPAIGIMLIGHSVHAHKPIMSDGSANSAETAIRIEDPQMSQVVYHMVTDRAPQVWLTFEVDEPQDLFLQIGIPVLERLGNYRPTLVLLGPGLPEIDLPLVDRQGLGGVVLDTSAVEDPRNFYEPITGTSSLILMEQDQHLPQAGRYYVVAYDPGGKPGKLWAAIGRTEEWGMQDLMRLGQIKIDVRRFHEHSTMPDLELQSGAHHLIYDFDTPDSSGRWTPVNDTVMGGVSESTCHITVKGFLEFAGAVSLENNGGFASMRSAPADHDLSAYQGVLMRVRGDGQRYAFNIRTDAALDGGSYRQSFDSKKGEWRLVPLPFHLFVPRTRGRVRDDAPALDAANVRSMGFTIADKQVGAFRLEIDWIRAVREFEGSQVVLESAKAGCATCVFGMNGVQGCRLAVEIDGKSHLVIGSGIDDHGGAQARDGLCNTARTANVRGIICNDYFIADEIEVLPE